MPIYEYRCEACGHELDALQKMSDEPLVDCPACGAASLRKKISAAAFRLSGSGWYETDFKDKGKRNLKESDSKPADKPAKKDKAKAETKPAATTEKKPKKGSGGKSAA